MFSLKTSSAAGTGQSIFGRRGATSSADRPSMPPASSTAPPEELPPGWRLMASRGSGKEYYLHIATGHTQWDRPTEADPPRTGADGAGAIKTTNVTAFGIRMGANITSMFNNSRFQSTLQGKAGPASLPTKQRGSATDVDREGQELVEIFENERLNGKPLPSDPKRFSDRDAGEGEGFDEKPDGDLPEGHEWATEWEVDPNFTAVDRDGWTYAPNFVEIVRLVNDELSHASRHPTDAVRRRRWIRYSQPQSAHTPRDPSDASADTTAASSTPLSGWGSDPLQDKATEPSPDEIDDDDDPFSRTAQKAQTGFRVNMKFTHRGGKDNTKDYQSITLGEIEWLVSASDTAEAPTDAMMREKAANLEERIKEAIKRSSKVETELRAEHDKRVRELALQQEKLDGLIIQYRKVLEENEALQARVATHRETVEALRKDATEKDILLNEEQRALNAEMSAANQALEEKAKALATARMRYKRDNKSLAEQVEEAKKRLQQQQTKADTNDQDPVSKDLKEEMDKVRQLHAKLEAVRQHRLAVEEESKTLFNLVVEKKADLKFKAKKKLEAALKEVDEKIETIKTEQAELTKKLAAQTDGDEQRQLNARRNEIRSELGALKERRAMLLAKKRRQEGND